MFSLDSKPFILTQRKASVSSQAISLNMIFTRICLGCFFTPSKNPVTNEPMHLYFLINLVRSVCYLFILSLSDVLDLMHCLKQSCGVIFPQREKKLMYS